MELLGVGVGMLGAVAIIGLMPRLGVASWQGIGFLAGAAMLFPWVIAQGVARRWCAGFTFRCQDCGSDNQVDRLLTSAEPER